MRKLVFLLALALLLLPSCAERPETEETEKTETETEEEYVKPPKDYLTQLAENLGYADYPDSVWCYQPALVSEEDFVSIDEIKFDMSEPSPERFISWHYYYDLEIINESTGDSRIMVYPNGNYLTTADGKREKLCPYEECREDYSEHCTHINLSDSYVIDDWVYFVGHNECIASPNHPNSDASGNVNMLMRYSISENRVEKLIDLPSYVHSSFCAYGVLYLNVQKSLENGQWLYMIDGKNGDVCRVDLSAPYFLPAGGTFYMDRYVCAADGKLYMVTKDGYKLVKCDPDFTDVVTLAALDGGYTFAGCCDDTVYFVHSYYTNGEMMTNPFSFDPLCKQPDITTDLLRLNDDGSITTVLSGLYYAFVRGDHVYAIPRTVRHIFDNTQPDARIENIYVNNTGVVLKYSLNKDGTVDEDSAVTVFDEKLHTSLEDEYLLSMEPFGDSVRVLTVFPPPIENNPLNGMHKYVLTEDGAREDGEGLLVESTEALLIY